MFLFLIISFIVYYMADIAVKFFNKNMFLHALRRFKIV